MKVILREDMDNLGRAGEVVKVADGYGRNYLIPRNLAVLADTRNLKALEHERKVIEARAKKARKSAEEKAAAIAAVSLVIPARAGEEGKLFGSVTSRDVADALAAKGVEVDRRLVSLDEPIKQVGDYKARVKVAAGIVSEVAVSVVAEG